jgi:gliding motility-associated-like protein
VSTGAVNYWQWTYSDSSFPATIQNPTHVFTTPGPHNVTLITSASASNTCAGSSVTHSVFVADKPVADMKDIIICERQQVQLMDSSYSTDGLAITQCWWDLGNGQFSNQCNPIVTYSTPGPKIIKHVVRNSRGCISDTMNITINVADKPHVNFGFDAPVCRDTTLQFHDSSTVSSGTVNQWNWIHIGSVFSTQQNPLGHFPFGNQQVGLSVTSSLGCYSDTIYKTFRLIKEPKLIYGFNDTCKYDPVVFSASENPTNIGITSWNWNFGDGNGDIQPNTSHTYTANGQYHVSLYAISSEGCSSDTLRDVVNIYGTNAFAGNDTIAAAGQPVQLHATGGVSYNWTPSFGLNNTNSQNPVATNSQDMTYYLEAYTPAGCKSYDTINIVIYKGPEIYIPTAFTPNDDGLNDVLSVLPIGLKSFNYFSIYNRYGQLLFTTNNKDKGWDGTFKGTRQPSGTYVFILSGIDFRGKPLFKKGTVLLIR